MEISQASRGGRERKREERKERKKERKREKEESLSHKNKPDAQKCQSTCFCWLWSNLQDVSFVFLEENDLTKEKPEMPAKIFLILFYISMPNARIHVFLWLHLYFFFLLFQVRLFVRRIRRRGRWKKREDQATIHVDRLIIIISLWCSCTHARFTPRKREKRNPSQRERIISRVQKSVRAS